MPVLADGLFPHQAKPGCAARDRRDAAQHQLQALHAAGDSVHGAARPEQPRGCTPITTARRFRSPPIRRNRSTPRGRRNARAHRNSELGIQNSEFEEGGSGQRGARLFSRVVPRIQKPIACVNSRAWWSAFPLSRFFSWQPRTADRRPYNGIGKRRGLWSTDQRRACHADDGRRCSGRNVGRRPRQSITDTNGVFAFDGIEPAQYILNVEKTGFAPYPDVFGDGPPARLTVDSDHKDLQLRIALKKGAVIAGRIVNAAGNRRPTYRCLPSSVPTKQVRSGSHRLATHKQTTLANSE